MFTTKTSFSAKTICWTFICSQNFLRSHLMGDQWSTWPRKAKERVLKRENQGIIFTQMSTINGANLLVSVFILISRVGFILFFLKVKLMPPVTL